MRNYAQRDCIGVSSARDPKGWRAGVSLLLAWMTGPWGVGMAQPRNEVSQPRWEQTISLTWEGESLGTAVATLSRQQGVPIFLDRRIDSGRTLSLVAEEQTVPEILREAGKFARADVAVVGGVLYLGPKDRAEWLLSLVEVRAEEQPGQVARRRSVWGWDEVSEPREVFTVWARAAGVEVRNVERIPHDVWGRFPATEVQPELTFVEGASLLLVGFDLAIQWVERGERPAVELVPFPDRIVRTRSYAVPRGQAAGKLRDRARTAFPDLELEVEGQRLMATGRSEELAELGEWLVRPGGETKPVRPSRDDKLANKRFTLAIKDVPLKALLETLEKNPDARLAFDLDEQVLVDAGIGFDRRVSIDVKQATIDELLAAIGREIGVEFLRDERKVTSRKKADGAR